MKSIFRSSRHKSSHQVGEKRKQKTPFFAKESKSPFFNASQGVVLQPKLKIGRPGDRYEKEADRMADAVVNGSAKPDIQNMEIGSIQRESLATPIEDEKLGTAEQRMEEDKLVQEKPDLKKMGDEEEEEMQMKRDEGAGMINRMEDEKEEEMQMKMEDEEESLQTKGSGNTATTTGPAITQRVKSRSGRGKALPKNTRDEMEASFATDFSDVTIHTDQEAASMSKALGAQAFTYGNNIFFNQGKYDTSTRDGKHLLAHELTHTVQQKGLPEKKAQKANGAWRYTPPKVVKRSIAEIQAIVGTTPDGVYGLKTRSAVIEYQKILKAKSLYTDTIDGKWGKNTDAAHNLFAVAPNAKRRGYNCAGFAFKKFKWINMVPTKTIYSKMKKLKNCSTQCNPFEYKFWYWEMDVQVLDTRTGILSKKHRDFHTVGGQTHKDGSDPKSVMSKNGGRPVEGPRPPMFWKVASGPAMDINGNPSPHLNWVISNLDEQCFCSNKLP
ncbi:DUF4157 domain-containing protein [Pricia sp. S334]|uniref:DUF4157 domain-containing protein n=1 Tax=Pricia mediterranea TaxID=3076079 RepID=A0ABU3L3B0_9FLAO|nr:DUF4157 domain-containing protein [Pricia sp. S334]MDT7828236.1 DUF4157 domain-containing protein [Pricia sp. S334]